TFTPNAAAVYSGTLLVDTLSFGLTAAAFDAPLATPALQFDQPLQSALQSPLRISLPSPASADASGFLALSFAPDSTVVADDPAILFLSTGGRSVPWSVKKGDTQVLLGGQASTAFQTGTTAGRIRFTFSAPAQGFASDPTAEFAIPAAPVTIDRTS